MKGTYLLMMMLRKEASIMVGKKGVICFQKGCYLYVGSAMNGLEQRIQRHLRSQKKIHWHIDYLLPYIEIVGIYYKENARKEECMVARMLARNFTNIPGFGCSDCSCQSHLFFGSLDAFKKIAVSLRMEVYSRNEHIRSP